MLTPQTTLTVMCPDGIQRRAQVTSVKDSVPRLSVRQGGVRYTGLLQSDGNWNNEFKATVGENGNVWQWLNVRRPDLMPDA
jgi:hypothetical protein